MGLKEYLLANYHDDKYTGRSLIYIYLNDRKHYKDLLNRAVIKPEANSFLSSYSQQLEDAESISTDAFRKLKYSELIDEYLGQKEKAELKSKPHGGKKDEKPLNDSKNASVRVFEGEHKDVYINLLCCHDRTKMHVTRIAKFRPNNSKEQITFPIYECPSCGRLYTSLATYPNKHRITASGKEYINLSPKMNSADYKKPGVLIVRRLIKANFFILEKNKNTCVNESCSKNVLKNIDVVLKNKKGKRTIQKVKWCKKCNAYYLPISQLNLLDFHYEIINKDELPEIEAQYQKKMEEKAERKRRQKEEKRLAEEARKQKQQKEAELSRKRLEEAKNRRTDDKKREIDNLRNNGRSKKSREEWATIDAKDFIVRRSVFRCMHENHQIEDIIASLTIIDKKGNERTVKISAGYCDACNVYFIMESTYTNLRRQGIPLCRVSDEKNYLNSSTNVNGMRLANESILMQYGYNVSQEEDLSEITRHKVLATLIDKHIMSKSEIISYLDFFISQRQSQSRYQLAIGKWEIDRNFVDNYRIGKYQEIGVLGLHY